MLVIPRHSSSSRAVDRSRSTPRRRVHGPRPRYGSSFPSVRQPLGQSAVLAQSCRSKYSTPRGRAPSGHEAADPQTCERTLAAEYPSAAQERIACATGGEAERPWKFPLPRIVGIGRGERLHDCQAVGSVPQCRKIEGANGCRPTTFEYPYQSPDGERGRSGAVTTARRVPVRRSGWSARTIISFFESRTSTSASCRARPLRSGTRARHYGKTRRRGSVPRSSRAAVTAAGRSSGARGPGGPVAPPRQNNRDKNTSTGRVTVQPRLRCLVIALILGS